MGKTRPSDGLRGATPLSYEPAPILRPGAVSLAQLALPLVATGLFIVLIAAVAPAAMVLYKLLTDGVVLALWLGRRLGLGRAFDVAFAPALTLKRGHSTGRWPLPQTGRWDWASSAWPCWAWVWRVG